MIIHLDRLQPRQTCKSGGGRGVEEKEPSEFCIQILTLKSHGKDNSLFNIP